MSEESNLPFFMKCVDHFGQPGDRGKYLRLYDPAIVLHGYGLAPGFDAVQAHYHALWAGFPDVTLRMDDVFEASDKLVSRFAVIGTHKGEFRGLPPTGRRIEYAGITILRFSSGRCIERWSQTDGVSVLQLLGVTQVPPPRASIVSR